jgi:hypothetical protein
VWVTGQRQPAAKTGARRTIVGTFDELAHPHGVDGEDPPRLPGRRRRLNPASISPGMGGVLYGMVVIGGSIGNGTVFEIVP